MSKLSKCIESRQPTLESRRVSFAAAIALFAAASCGGVVAVDGSGDKGPAISASEADAGSHPGTSATSSPSSVPGTVPSTSVADAGVSTSLRSGRITIRVKGITGAVGKVIRVAAASFREEIVWCRMIASDPYDGGGTLNSSVGARCEGGEPQVFTAGTYQISLAIHTPGVRIAEQGTEINVTVNGDVEVTVPYDSAKWWKAK